MSRKTFKVRFTYERVVTVYLEADGEDDIHDFLDETDWDPLRDNEDMVDDDQTADDSIEYDVESTNITADFAIVDGQLVETES